MLAFTELNLYELKPETETLTSKLLWLSDVGLILAELGLTLAELGLILGYLVITLAELLIKPLLAMATLPPNPTP